MKDRLYRFFASMYSMLAAGVLAAIAIPLVSAPGCAGVSATNLVWFEATAGTNGVVESQGPGRTLALGCTTEGIACRFTVRMLLQTAEPLRGWSLSLLGDSGSALLEVADFDYTLTTFNTTAGGETFGDEPNLLSGAGTSSSATDQVPAGRYTLATLELVYDNPAGATTERTILAQFGSRAWADADPDDQVPPLIQIGANLPVPVLSGTILPEAVIVVRPARANDNVNNNNNNGNDNDNDNDNDNGNDNDDDDHEMCGDGRDNDGDGRTDCDDGDCTNHMFCRTRPTIQCPSNLTLECDGSGNDAAVNAWLDSATAQTVCNNLTLTDNFSVLANPCGEAGTASVTWTASDSCGSENCSASLSIVDTTRPSITAPDDLTFVCDESGTQTQLRTWLSSSIATDICGDVVRTVGRSATTFNCSATMLFSAADECGNTNTDSALLTIQGDTDAPRMTLNGAAASTLECGVDTYTEQGASVVDDCDTTLTAPAITGNTVNTRLPGTYVLTYDAMDLCGRSAPRQTRTVTVVDTRPSRVELIDIRLSPANHDYVTLDLSDCARLVDDCDGELDIDTFGRIISATSSEPDDANGDGNTTDDVVVVDSNTFRVRAERQGDGDGRTYSINFEVIDPDNRRITATCLIEVPHDQSGGNDDDDDDGDDD